MSRKDTLFERYEALKEEIARRQELRNRSFERLLQRIDFELGNAAMPSPAPDFAAAEPPPIADAVAAPVIFEPPVPAYTEPEPPPAPDFAAPEPPPIADAVAAPVIPEPPSEPIFPLRDAAEAAVEPAPVPEPPAEALVAEPSAASSGPAEEAAVQAPSRRRNLWLLGGCAALLALGAAVARHLRLARGVSVVQSFAFPYPRAVGLALRESELLTLDLERQAVLRLSLEDGRVLGEENFPVASADGMTYGAGYIWSTSKGRILQHDPAKGLAVRKAFVTPHHRPTGIFWDGGHLWTSDPRTQTVNEYVAGEALAPVRQYNLPRMAPVGFYSSENLLWVLDAATRKVYRYHPGVSLSGLDAIDLGRWLPAGCVVEGFAMDGTRLWVLTDSPGALYRFDVKRLSSSS